MPVPDTEVYEIILGRDQADAEIGLEIHPTTRDVIVSYVGPSVEGVTIGDAVLTIHGHQVHGQTYFDDGNVEIEVDNLEIARHLLKEPSAPTVSLTVEKATLRTEIDSVLRQGSEVS